MPNTINNILHLGLLFLLLSGCARPLHETIVDVKTGEVVGGFNPNGPLSLTKNLRKKDFSADTIQAWRQKGIALFYTLDTTQTLAFIEVGGERGDYQRCRTSRGLAPGDPISKARKLYGKPRKKKKIYWNISDQPAFMYHLWLYKDLSIYFYENDVIFTIGVGKNLYFDK
jgi:hypothetical protein